MPCPGCGKVTVLGGALQPTQSGAEHAARARQLVEAGQHVEALREYDRAILAEPTNGGLDYLRANHLLFELNRPEDARQGYVASLEKQDDPGAWCNLGLCLAVLGKPAEGARCIERAIRTKPHPIPMVLLGFCLTKAGKHEEGKAWLGKARELDPAGEMMPRARHILSRLGY